MAISEARTGIVLGEIKTEGLYLRKIEWDDSQKIEYLSKAALSDEEGEKYLNEILMFEHGLDGGRLRRALRSCRKGIVSLLKEDHSLVMDWMKKDWASNEIDGESILLIRGDEMSFQPSVSEISGIPGKVEHLLKILGDGFSSRSNRPPQQRLRGAISGSLVNCLFELHSEFV